STTSFTCWDGRRRWRGCRPRWPGPRPRPRPRPRAEPAPRAAPAAEAERKNAGSLRNRRFCLAGRLGFEPRLPGPEPGGLPLPHLPAASAFILPQVGAKINRVNAPAAAAAAGAPGRAGARPALRLETQELPGEAGQG